MAAARRVPLPRAANATERSRAERTQKALRATFARNLRLYREEADLTLRALSALTGISASYLSNAEQGRRNVTLDIVASLASFLGKPPADFLTD